MSPVPEEIRSEYDRLLVTDVGAQLPGISTAGRGRSHNMSEMDISRLIGASSALALSDDAEDRMVAYSILSRLLNLHGAEFPGLVAAANETMARLGNFPARALLESRFCSSLGEVTPPFFLEMESWVRQQENTVAVSGGASEILTDFQFDLLDMLNRTRTSSISAPTSAGKSFVLSLYLQQQLRENDAGCIVYLVPTRALIRQVQLRVVRLLSKTGQSNVPVRSVPLPLRESEADRKIVYVLTQERLLSLLFSDEERPNITTLIVDEAQGVADGGRGVILQTAVDIVIQECPNVDIHFASPLSSNPGFLPQLFGRGASSENHIERESPVLQNIIHVNPVRRRPREAKFELQTDGTRTTVETRTLDYGIGGGRVAERRARFALAITKEDECTIVYANRPTDAEDIATALVRSGELVETDDPAITEFISFLQEHIHPDYQLIEALRSRCAFHYGFMPQVVRDRVEELFTANKIRFICCTSTLLQGVNLPAKHVILENPRRGQRQPMDRASFLNLAGRAGRLLHEFHGNVWCLRSDSWDVPDGASQACFEGEPLQETRTAFDEMIAGGADDVRKLLQNEPVPRSVEEFASAALGRIFVQYVRAGRQAELIGLVPEQQRAQIAEIVRLCEEMSVDISPMVVRRNWTVNPRRLQELHDEMSRQDDIEAWTPLAPWARGSNRRIKEVFQRVDEILAGRTGAQYRYYAQLAFKWELYT